MLNKFKILSIFIFLNVFGSAQDAGTSNSLSSIRHLIAAIEQRDCKAVREFLSQARDLSNLQYSNVVRKVGDKGVAKEFFRAGFVFLNFKPEATGAFKACVKNGALCSVLVNRRLCQVWKQSLWDKLFVAENKEGDNPQEIYSKLRGLEVDNLRELFPVDRGVALGHLLFRNLICNFEHEDENEDLLFYDANTTFTVSDSETTLELICKELIEYYGQSIRKEGFLLKKYPALSHWLKNKDIKSRFERVFNASLVRDRFIVVDRFRYRPVPNNGSFVATANGLEPLYQ